MNPHDPNDEMRSKVKKVPREIFFDIFSRLPLKSVIRTSCVSKSWLDMIKDPYFVKLHVSRSKPDPSLLILAHHVFGEKNIVSMSPINYKHPLLNADETAIDHMVSSCSWHLVGTCDGLLCFTSFGKEKVTMVCNPVTREHIILPKPAIALSSESQAPSLGFGFDPVAKKYKVVRVLSGESSGSRSGPRRVGRVLIPANQVAFHADPDNHVEFNADPDDHVEFQADPGYHVEFDADFGVEYLAVPDGALNVVPYGALNVVPDFGVEYLAAPDARMRRSAVPVAFTRAEVYTLGTDCWREVHGFNYPCLHGESVYANGAVHWLVDRSNRDDRILTFDLGSEQFKLTPHRRFGTQISLTELGGCLAVVDLSSRNNVEISVLKDPTGMFWELAYIIPLDKFGQQLSRKHPRLICVHELKNGLLIWLQDNLLLYDKKTFIRRHPKISGLPIWLDWKICSGYRASLVPLGNARGTGDNQRDIVHFISGQELDILLLRGTLM